jgi:hypothetical protein
MLSYEPGDLAVNADVKTRSDMFEELLNTLLSLACEAFAGKAVLAFYAPDALVAFNGKVQRRAEVDDTEYAWAFAEFETFGRDALCPDVVLRPELKDAKCHKMVEEPGNKFVVWFTCDEPSTPSPVAVATGWELHAGRPAVAWMTVAETLGDWTFEHGRMMAAGDAAYLEGSCFITPRSWLDLGWYRVHGHRRPKLNIPDGARFACHSSGDCCSIGFDVKVPAHAQHVIDSVNWEQHAPHLQGTRLPEADDGKLWLKQPGEKCRFLDENSHCRIHKIFGRAVFDVCANYPLFFVETPDGVDVWASQTCSSVRGGFGPLLEDRKEDLYARLAFKSQKNQIPHYFINEADEPSNWELFRNVEDSLVSHLSQHDVPLLERLRRGQEVLDTYAPLPALPPKDAACGGQEEDWKTTLEIWTGFFTTNQVILNAGRPTLFPEEERDLANTLVQHLRAKETSIQYGLRLAHHFNILIFRALEKTILAVAPKEQALSQSAWWKLNARILHQDLLHQSPGHTDGNRWLKDPGFVAYLLAV